MKPCLVPALILPAVFAIAAQPTLKIGLDTQATEWIISLEGGGQVCDRTGKPLMKLAPEEKLRIWWDSRGLADPTTEYRIQVGRAHSAAEAAALIKRLRELVGGQLKEAALTKAPVFIFPVHWVVAYERE